MLRFNQLLELRPEMLAAVRCIPMTQAHGYLTELALPQLPLTDLVGWRKMAILRPNARETLRWDYVKLTPVGLARLIGASERICHMKYSTKFPLALQRVEGVIAAKQSWNKHTS